MRRNKTITIGEAINQYLKDLNVDRKIKEVTLINSWENTMGKTIAKYTKDLYIRNEVLFVSLDSSVVRTELLMMKQKIIDVLNEGIGEKIISDIVFK